MSVTGTLTIPSTIEGCPVVAIGNEAFYECGNLTSVTLPDSVTSIGGYAFCKCENLTSINIPNGVTNIADSTFAFCSSLTDAVIPSGVTNIDVYAFYYCSSLTDVVIPNGVTNIGDSAFAGCTGLTYVVLPDSVTNIGSRGFSGCSSLTDVYYKGSEADRANMTIVTPNSSILNAAWHYNTCSSEHTYDDACDTDCNICGDVRETSGHVYDDEYDADCNVCGCVREVPDKPIEPTDQPLFVVDGATAKAGDTVTVTVRTERNTGIVAFKVEIGYDATVLEPVSITGQDFAGTTYGPLANNPISVSWVAAVSPNNTTNGVVAVLTFRVKEDAPEGATAITVTYPPDDVYDYDFENVTFGTVDGTITVINNILGDANGDGLINNKDVGLLQRYINGWDVEINTTAADANGDGIINNKDVGILQRHLNGWDTVLSTPAA